MEEYLDIYDADWKPTGEVLEKAEAERLGKWHRIVHFWIINSKGELLQQLRSRTKKIYPGMWDSSTGGHVQAGETLIDAGIREMFEELGVKITAGQITEMGRNNFEKFWHLRTMFLVRLDLPLSAFSFNDNEVEAVRWMPWKQLYAMSEEDVAAAGIMPTRDIAPLFEYLSRTQA